MRGGRGGAPARHPVGLLDQRDAEARGTSGSSRRAEIRRTYAAARAVPQYECAEGLVHRLQLNARATVRCTEFQDETSLAAGTTRRSIVSRGLATR